MLCTSACVYITIFPLQKSVTNLRHTLSIVGIYQKQDMAHCISFQEYIPYTSKGFSTRQQTLQLQSSRLAYLVLTLRTPVQIWQWAGQERQQSTHLEESHSASIYAVPDLHKGPRMSLKMASLNIYQTIRKPFLCAAQPKRRFHALNILKGQGLEYGTLHHCPHQLSMSSSSLLLLKEGGEKKKKQQH